MYQRILVPVDGSDLSERAIIGSIALAHQLGAAVIGFVAEPLMAPVSGPRQQSLLEEQVKGHDAMTAAHAKAVLSRFEARAQEAGVPF
jgi:nucleotide-binding universal stress UspA family protein